MSVSAPTKNDRLSSALSLLDELVLHSETRNCVRGRNPGDDEAAGGNFGYRLRDVNHRRKRGGLALCCSHYRESHWLVIQDSPIHIPPKPSVTSLTYRIHKWWWSQNVWPLCAQNAARWSADPRRWCRVSDQRWCTSLDGQELPPPSTGCESFSVKSHEM